MSLNSTTLLLCNACGEYKDKINFSKTQQQKGAKKRCRKCIDANIAINSGISYHWHKIKSLVNGYIREIEFKISMSYIIPLDIYGIILSFYGRQFIIYGIGKNSNGEFGIGENKEVINYKYFSLLFSIDSPVIIPTSGRGACS